MFKSLFLVTLRSIYKEKVYAIINILGLSLALACSLILFLYVRSELTYDMHFNDYDRIVRIGNDFTVSGKTEHFSIVSFALGPLFLKEYPQVGEFARFTHTGELSLKSEDVERTWKDIYLADDTVFKVFSHKVIYGDPETALVDPSSMAISESLSKFYFGNENPIGKTLHDGTFPHHVTLVFEDLPQNTHLKYSALISRNGMSTFGEDDKAANYNQLFNVNLYTYLKVSKDFDQSTLPLLLNDFYSKRASGIGKQFNIDIKYFTQPLTSIHFDKNLQYDQPTGNLFYIFGFAAIAIFILVIACINYTNLSTARASKRSKEVGMRKVLGSSKSQLAFQFFIESFLYTIVSLILSLIIIEIAEVYTPLNSLLGKDSLLSFGHDPEIIAWLAIFSVSVAFVAGIYPAIYLTSISPLAALTAVKRSRSAKFQLRQFLVFIQFFVSVAVVACTILMALQLSYVSSKPIGFQRENLIAITLKGVDTIERIPVIREELLKIPGVLAAEETSYVPGNNTAVSLVSIENNQGQMQMTTVNNIVVGRQYLDTMSMEIAEGRDFSKRLLTDIGQSYIVNETLVKKMGWDDALGKRIEFAGGGRVIGVVKDFHFASLHQAVEPILIRVFSGNELDNIPQITRNFVSRDLVVKMNGENLHRTINEIESIVYQFQPHAPFSYRFIEDVLNQLYLSESKLMKLTGIFSGICILISCLGLYGLSSFTTEQRTKEIGVRKALGASTTQIIILLSKTQMNLVLLAAVFASASSYLVMDDWLHSYAYRTNINLWVFLFAALVVASIAFATVALQSAKTASSNPVDALRYE